MRTSGAGSGGKHMMSSAFPFNTGSKIPLTHRVSKRRAAARVAKQARKVNRVR